MMGKKLKRAKRGGSAQLKLRLSREAQDLKKNHSDQFRLDIVDKAKLIWHIHFEGAEGSLYAKEQYTLQFKFGANYPFESAEIMFIGKPPIHEHIYSCGFICLSTLYDDWSPALKTSTVCLSILSMMSSATEKKAPKNNEATSRRMMGKSPKEMNWLFEDENC